MQNKHDDVVHKDNVPIVDIESVEQSSQETLVKHYMRKSTKEHQPLKKITLWVYYAYRWGEPIIYTEDSANECKNDWLKAKQEMDSLHKNCTDDLMRLPKGEKALKNKWVFRLKTK